MEKDRLNLVGKRIGIFGKGGSGKSTLTALLAMGLNQRGYHVCVLDADSTNVGLHQAFGFDQSPTPLLDHFGGVVFSGGLVTCPVDDPAPIDHASVNIDRLPSKYYQKTDHGLIFLAAGKIGDQGPGAGCDGPIAKIARDLVVYSDREEFVNIIDFKAGFEDSARGVLTSLDWVIVVVDPTTAAVEMAVNMKEMVEQIKSDVLPATAHLETEEMVFLANKIFTEAAVSEVFCVLNKIPNTEVEDYLRKKLAHYRIEPLGSLHLDEAISLSWLKGRPLFSPEANEEIKNLINKLEQFEIESDVIRNLNSE
ncbi:MAG: P-loop NTPase [Anaerolineales bacterium]|nr:P-loop NTPase [Anaerolineales bacterium]